MIIQCMTTKEAKRYQTIKRAVEVVKTKRLTLIRDKVLQRKEMRELELCLNVF